MELWLPFDVKPAYRCRICGDRFTARENRQYEAHAAKCFSRHEAEVMPASPRYSPVLGDDGFDTELEDYMRRGNGPQNL